MKLHAGGALLQACRRSSSVCLTFDDGPGQELTPKVLDILASHDARATFFLLGRCAAKAPEVVARLVRDRHEVGCHTQDHLDAWKTRPARVRRDIDDGFRTLSPWVATDGMFRPPYGRMTPSSLWHLRKRRAPVVLWTHDSGDTHARLPVSTDQIVERIVSDGGGVVLMHDFDRTSEAKSRTAFVLELTEKLVRRARSAGLRPVTIGEMLAGAA